MPPTIITLHSVIAASGSSELAILQHAAVDWGSIIEAEENIRCRAHSRLDLRRLLKQFSDCFFLF